MYKYKQEVNYMPGTNETKDVKETKETEETKVETQTTNEEETKTATDNQATDGVKIHKAFATEEEYNNKLKSERSKGKHEILEELGIQSVKEGKEALAQAKEAGELKQRAEKLETELLLTKEGVKEEYTEEALILARAKVNEETDLKAALSGVLEKFPKMRSATNPKPKIGGDTGAEDDEDTINSHFKNNPKYAHIKL